MTKARKDIEEMVTSLVQPYLDEHDFELVDVEYVKEGQNRFLRVFADKTGGIDIEDCGRISEYLSAKLDESDPIPDAYFLEVSSPGAERPLKKAEDFAAAIGKMVYVSTYEQIDGQKEFEGELITFTEQSITIRQGKKQLEFPKERIAAARLAVTF